MTKPKPIDDPHAGHTYVSAAWCMPNVDPDPDIDPPDAIADDLRRELKLWVEEYGGSEGLYVTVRVIGAGGEASEHEGTVGL